jgi:anti-sigma regulatory factor (Ser/Thr protein kinase)
VELPLQSSDGRMASDLHRTYKIEDRSYLNIIKKDIFKVAQELGFGNDKIGRIDIIVSELGTNLIKFGIKKREILWKPVFVSSTAGIEILAIDKGQGISSINQALQDGYSTSGTPGEGLGAVQRLSDHFDIYSQPDTGTIVLSRIFKNSLAAAKTKSSTIGVINKPKDGEVLCGDGYMIEALPTNDLNLLVLDGLGHGPEAHKASALALKLYQNLSKGTPHQVLMQLHEGLKQTRGAVGMVLHYKAAQKQLIYCGVGNIAGKVLGFETNKALISFNGILGHTMSRIHDNTVSWESGKLLILHSDGINTRWDLSLYPNITRHDPSIIAACLYRDFNRNNDDITIVVSKTPVLQ